MLFREMRRNKQQLKESEVIDILKNCNTGVLGVLGDGGYPYTVPVNYVYDDGKIYIHCAKVGHKFDAVKACDKVSLCVIEKDEPISEKFTTNYRSVIAFGRARILEDAEEIYSAVMRLGLKFNPNKKAVEKEIADTRNALSCIEITVEHMSGKKSIELV
jgi:hypothetical protein